jgi:hypothetical protein
MSLPGRGVVAPGAAKGHDGVPLVSPGAPLTLAAMSPTGMNTPPLGSNMSGTPRRHRVPSAAGTKQEERSGRWIRTSSNIWGQT